jgi:hypothetical protein
MVEGAVFYQVRVVVGPDGEFMLAGFRSADRKAVLDCVAMRISVPFDLDYPHPDILQWIEQAKGMGGINLGDPVVKRHNMTEVVWEIST